MTINRRRFISSLASLAAWSALRAEGGTSLAPSGGNAPIGDLRFIRRASLAICGRLPTWEEASAYASSREPGKRATLVDRLMASDAYVDFRTMHLADELRVKSEFPINLWPNAVYVYHARIRRHVAEDEPWGDFMRALLSAKGSNFKVPESNFLRASAVRTSSGLSETASLTFLGKASKEYAPYFKDVKYSDTREWKEEIVSWPNGPISPAALADIFAKDPRVAETAVSRAWFRLFGAYPDATTKREYASVYARSGGRMKQVIRAMAMSDAFASVAYVPRRLEAEVLDDAICTLTGATRNYQSIAPEPFTFLPGDRPTVCIEDGSVTSSFLLLFGRPARDTGEIAERDDTLTAKQRLYLMNSMTLFRRLGDVRGKVEGLFRRFLTREPTAAEKKLFKKSRLRARDIAWCLVNSEEFLFRG